MVELYFLIYRLPRMMSELARERNRSAVGWSLAAIAGWIGAEIAVIFGYTIIHAIGEEQWGWSQKDDAGVMFLIYVIALGAAILGASVVRRILRSMPASQPPPPPPPPQF